MERDVRAAGVTGTLRLVIPDCDDSGQAWVEFQGIHHGNGIWPIAGSDPQWALASVADATQEVIMEMIWGVWPVCSAHGLGLRAELEHEMAVWRCTGAERIASRRCVNCLPNAVSNLLVDHLGSTLDGLG
jgi:hypothetical protein